MERLCSKLLKEQLSLFPCISIIGARQSGKTTLLKSLQGDWKIFDLEKLSDNLQISEDPDLFFRTYPDKIAIDEAQLLPRVFNSLRVAIDDDRNTKGRFIFTGSSSPSLLKNISESLAGRVGIIEMSPLTFAETQSRLDSSFFDAFSNSQISIDKLFECSNTPCSNINDIFSFWYKGGFPEPWLSENREFHRAWMDNYFQTYIERDIGRLFPGINGEKFRLFIRLLAGVSGSVINYSDVARSLGVSAPTAHDYFEIAHGSYLWRTIPQFDRKSIKRLVRHPKGYLRDTGLLHYLLKIPDIDILNSHPVKGASWESMVIEEILRGLAGRGVSADASYYRTQNGAEVDLVLEGMFGLVPIEIKYSQTVSSRDLKSLADFMDEFKAKVGIVINNDIVVRKYTDKIIGIPFGMI
ncbi:MAG: ATP-binding protein [Fibrobacteres bacterium]|nr:ATP-binding protein [Fibrobacterota bacterium]